MAKDKGRTLNPAQAQRKLEKQRALKKGKAEQQARRNEKLARRNPARLERQVKDLKAVEEAGGQLKPHEKARLEELERDLKAVLKAREALGDAAPQFPSAHNARRDGTTLGKRARDRFDRSGRHDDDSSDTDEDVLNIPMPRDKSPPIPREYWDRQRERRAARDRAAAAPPDPSKPAADTTLPSMPAAPVVSKAVYEAAPDIRNLQQEAISRFVPATVQQKMKSVTGAGQLLEPEELDRLESAGYVTGAKVTAPTSGEPLAASFDADLEALHNLNQAHVEDADDE
ncbi:hypothetical protein KEM52_005931 [Ascosphaera acerosa]|nr:hypothetical protein KEM52_005931 [Ascosphaera acerosa]